MNAKDNAVEMEEIKQYAPEFITTVAETAESAVLDWMRANHVPDEVTQLAGDAFLLERFSTKAQYGRGAMSDVDIKEFEENLPEVTEYIARLGGVFVGPETRSFSREDVLTWQPEEK
jgi:hypothetical protein